MTKYSVTAVVGWILVACNTGGGAAAAGSAAAASAAPKAAASQAPQRSLPPLDPRNIVSIAAGSKDHTTLVQALQAADYVTSVANPGPLTVFAPTNAAFDKLPAGTVEGLLKPEKKDELREVLKYHVTTSVHETTSFQDGDTLSMANGAKCTIGVKDGKVTINGANVVASIRASNGIVHVIDGVLLPPKKE
ncbi:MAG: fasciclin domain-containing protein [Polyangiaceae bacterium]|nr:fasciclin domain-containing protein [Polyangiaceae bacterium]